MDMHERIKKIRNDQNLTQNEFAQRLGVTRSVISNIELNRLAKPEQKTSLIKLISKEFSINEEWLLNGTGSEKIESDTFSLDEYIKSKGATQLELDLIKSYFEIPEDLRNSIMNSFKHSVLKQMRNTEEAATTESSELNDIDYEVESYRKELEAEQKGQISSASEKPKGA
ncbi:transcriptional regulator with XRE-family HTH domain [Clostridium butyricum]|nr:XRE family Transcriptional regulator [Clostridium butyricum]MBA8967684.1 transcriptional regulator with XRE-family HTH domain [Clostridium butyricum]MBA8971248.1 transcriptional regulator with XRE-family HTH domain [Clostridium butyricum]MBC2427570.1 helix-turn-helix transcriptional regulator [Clostridium butyricum]NOW36885.1 transcriptional regulator with XRE-family HTH domain [Clostridium butyricum]